MQTFQTRQLHLVLYYYLSIPRILKLLYINSNIYEFVFSCYYAIIFSLQNTSINHNLETIILIYSYNITIMHLYKTIHLTMINILKTIQIEDANMTAVKLFGILTWQSIYFNLCCFCQRLREFRKPSKGLFSNNTNSIREIIFIVITIWNNYGFICISKHNLI